MIGTAAAATVAGEKTATAAVATAAAAAATAQPVQTAATAAAAATAKDAAAAAPTKSSVGDRDSGSSDVRGSDSGTDREELRCSGRDSVNGSRFVGVSAAASRRGCRGGSDNVSGGGHDRRHRDGSQRCLRDGKNRRNVGYSDSGRSSARD